MEPAEIATLSLHPEECVSRARSASEARVKLTQSASIESEDSPEYAEDTGQEEVEEVM